MRIAISRARTAMLAVLLAFPAALAQACASDTYDRISEVYRGFLDPNDPLSFDLKIAQLSKNRYTFWRGSKDLFFQWVRAECRDWLGDERNYVTTHGDLHAGNIGAYLVNLRHRSLAIGPVDFDDSARLPFQLELVQGIVTLQLASPASITPDQQKSLRDLLFHSYRKALLSQSDSTALLEGESAVEQLFSKDDEDYATELATYTENDRFRERVLDSHGKLKELLRPIAQKAPYASALQQAVNNSPELAGLRRPFSESEWHSAIKAVARRTRLGSSGSQGLMKFLVLVDRPFKGLDHDVIFYLKQQIPTAAERSIAVEPDPRSPGQRCAEDQLRLTAPNPLFSSWCEIDGMSFWVFLKEPWSEELDASDFGSFEKMQTLARIWGTVAGAAHRRAGPYGLLIGEDLNRRLSEEQVQVIARRADRYLEQLYQEYESLKTDPRTEQARKRAEAALK